MNNRYPFVFQNEVNHETDQMIQEINDLAEAKRVLEKTLAETANPLHIAQECLYNREKRQGIDLVHDPVERELIKVRQLQLVYYQFILKSELNFMVFSNLS